MSGVWLFLHFEREEKRRQKRRWRTMEAAAVEEEDGDQIVVGEVIVMVVVGEVIVMEIDMVGGEVGEIDMVQAEEAGGIVMVPVEVGVMEVGEVMKEEAHGADLVLVTVWPDLGMAFLRFNGTFLDSQFLRRIFISNTLMFRSALIEMPKIGDVLLTSLLSVMEFQRCSILSSNALFLLFLACSLL
jgi:hypothetical protein